MHDRFWTLADELVAAHEIVIDRPKGSRHPPMPSAVYPLDYGYLARSTGGDGAGVEVWRGSLPDQRVTGAIITVDTLKRDAEVKLLIGCTPGEASLALMMHNQPSQSVHFPASRPRWGSPSPTSLGRGSREGLSPANCHPPVTA